MHDYDKSTCTAGSGSFRKGAWYYLKGDLNQMYTAKRIAGRLGIQTDVSGGIPYVTSKGDFERLKEYLVTNKVEGWWNYVSDEEFLRLDQQ